jgi:SAM-dependent methyltransferase
MPDNEPNPKSISQRFRQQSESFNKVATYLSIDAHLPEGKLGSWFENRNLQTYLDNLPTFSGLSFVDVLREKKKSRLLDIGCGDRAVAISELVDKYPEMHIEATGLTLPLKRTNFKNPFNVNVVRQDAQDFFRTKGKSQKFDVIISSITFGYFAHPLTTLKQAYEHLEEGGYLFINDMYHGQNPIVDQNGTVISPKQWEAILRSLGYSVEITEEPREEMDPMHIYRLAMKKTKPHLKLPVRIVYPEKLGLDLSDRQALAGTQFQATNSKLQYLYQLTVPLIN